MWVRMAIDDLLGSLHDDRLQVTASLREKLSTQRQQREQAGQFLTDTLREQIHDLKEQENLLLPNGGMADLNRQERLRITERRMEKELSLAHEPIQLQRDMQQALMYELHLTREEVEEEQTHAWMNGVFY